MTSASGASPTETSFNEIEHDASTTDASARSRSKKRKARLSPSSSRAALSDVDSGEDAEETHRKRVVDASAMPPPPPQHAASLAKRRRRRTAAQTSLSNRSDSDESGNNNVLEADAVGGGVLLSVEESLESASTMSFPAPAAPRLRPQRPRARRSRVAGGGSEERGATILDSAEDAEADETIDVLLDSAADTQRGRRALRRGALAPPTSVSLLTTSSSLVGAFSFAMPAPRRRRVRIAAVAQEEPLVPLSASKASSGDARLSSGDNESVGATAFGGSSAGADTQSGDAAAAALDSDDDDDDDEEERDDVVARLRVARRRQVRADDSRGEEGLQSDAIDAIEAFEEHLAAEAETK